MPFPVVAAVAALLTAAKAGVDAYSNTRVDRATRRMRNRAQENDETVKRDQRRDAVLRALNIHAPQMPQQLQKIPNPPDLTKPNTLAGLLGFGANVASLYGANAIGGASGASQSGADVPMPYQGQVYPSAYGPGSTIKPYSPYR